MYLYKSIEIFCIIRYIMYTPTTTDSLFPKSNSLRKWMAYAKPIALQMLSIKMQTRAKPTSSRPLFGLTRKKATLDQHSSAFHKPINYTQSCGKICPTLLQGEFDSLRPQAHIIFRRSSQAKILSKFLFSRSLIARPLICGAKAGSSPFASSELALELACVGYRPTLSRPL
jgi:hypothetical protein